MNREDYLVTVITVKIYEFYKVFIDLIDFMQRNQMLRKVEVLKKEINEMIESGDYDQDELLKKSQELDIYIVKDMKEKLLNMNEASEGEEVKS